MTTQNIKNIKRIKPIGQVKATVRIPGSKSYTLRAVCAAAMAQNDVMITGALTSEDTIAAKDCLQKLGLHLEQEDDVITLRHSLKHVPKECTILDVNQSGVTMRLLTALACLLPGTQIIGGTASLNARPISPLVDALRSLGASIEYMGCDGYPPLVVHRSKMAGDKIVIDGSQSSQYISAVLLIAPLLQGDTVIQISGHLVSEPYIDMTIDAVREFGATVRREGSKILVPGGQHYTARRYHVEGDASSASYFWAIAALTNSTITTTNINVKSKQADMAMLDILIKMGAKVRHDDTSITVQGSSLTALNIAMESCPDQIMTVAVIAAFAHGTTTISGIRTLRIKECDRVQAILAGLARMGIPATADDDTLTIHGGNPHCATIETYSDHRIAMAFGVAGCKLDGVTIEHPSVVRKTYPDFWRDLEKLSRKERHGR